MRGFVGAVVTVLVVVIVVVIVAGVGVVAGAILTGVAPEAHAQESSTFLGVRCDSGVHPTGVPVRSTVPGSAAQRIGLAPGDRIREFEGAAIGSYDDLRAAVRGRGVGDSVVVGFVRDGVTRLAVPVLCDESRPFAVPVPDPESLAGVLEGLSRRAGRDHIAGRDHDCREANRALSEAVRLHVPVAVHHLDEVEGRVLEDRATEAADVARWFADRLDGEIPVAGRVGPDSVAWPVSVEVVDVEGRRGRFSVVRGMLRRTDRDLQVAIRRLGRAAGTARVRISGRNGIELLDGTPLRTGDLVEWLDIREPD